jgi:hypothetical protein
MEHTRIRTVPERRGPVRRFNDDTMEYLIATARAGAAVSLLAVLGSTVALIWTGDVRWALTVALSVVVTVVAGWFGYVKNANEGWEPWRDRHRSK